MKFIAFELPFSEVSGGKDGVLYGGQAQTDWQFSTKVAANVNVSYYDWNHPDLVVLGLGAATKVDALEIRWPSGRVEKLQDLASDHFYSILEGEGVVPAGRIRPASRTDSK